MSESAAPPAPTGAKRLLAAWAEVVREAAERPDEAAREREEVTPARHRR